MSGIPELEPFPLLLVDDALGQTDFSQMMIIPPSRMPEPYRKLLVHHHHMTVTLEDFYQDRVDVQVLSTQRLENAYHREIILKTQQSHKIVQYGSVRIDLNFCAPDVRSEILAEKTPLGRILINHNVLRRIEPSAFLCIQPHPKLIKYLQLKQEPTLYGRMGVIFCDNHPAIAVAEILTPID